MNDNQVLLPAIANFPQVQIEYVPISALKLNESNPRVHSEKQITNIAKNIDKFGFVFPCTVDEDLRVLAGNARVQAAARLGMTRVPVVRLRHLTEADKRALIIAENRLPELASWDEQSLRQEFEFLSEVDIDFDFSSIGYETAEVDFILDGGKETDDGADALPSLIDMPAVSRLGDLWLLNRHRLYCGNALNRSSYTAVLAKDRAAMVFTDPPYNVRINGHVRGKGAVKHREFTMASGEMTPAEFVAFLSASVSHIEAFVRDGAICFIFMDWRHVAELLAATKALTLANVCVWVKNKGGMGSLYRSAHELVFVFKCGAANHVNNVQLGKHGRYRTNVWQYNCINSFGADRNQLLASHPTVKPVPLVADAIQDCSNRGDVILDPFGGSGTTLIASEKTARRAALIEIDPIYVDATIRRWQAYTGDLAVDATTGATFNECEQVAKGGVVDGSASGRESCS